jgi:TetR/AcrR family transcriptional regulator, acrAB operon repressor
MDVCNPELHKTGSIMVRKTREDAVATREALLDAAEQVFRAKGVAHATLADVAQAAGLTRGAVYWHFRDKAEMLAAVCERAALPMEAMIACRGEDGTRPALAILRDHSVQALMQLARDPRTQAVFDVIFNKWDCAGDSASMLDRRRFSDEGCRQHVIGLLRRAVRDGSLPDDTDVAMAAEMMRAFMVGVMHVWTRNPAAYSLERSAAAMIDTLIAGLVAHPPRIVGKAVVPYRTAAVAAD